MIETILMLLFGLVFLGQNYMFFRLIGKVVPIKVSTFALVLTGIVNCVAVITMMVYFESNTAVMYLIITLIYIVEMYFIYDAKVMSVISYSISLPIHLMALRGISVSAFAMIYGYSIYQVVITNTMMWITLIMTSVFSMGFMAALFKLIPDKYFKMIDQETNRMTLFCVLAVVTVSQLIISGSMYDIDINIASFPLQQILTDISWMTVLYTGVFMLIGFEVLDARREKLQDKLLQESLYKNMLLVRSELTIELNCTEDKIVSLTYKGKDKKRFTGADYTSFLCKVVEEYIHEEDKRQVYANMESSSIIRAYKNGKKDVDIEYRMKQSDDTYRWFSARISSEYVDESDIIRALIINTDIQEEKEKEAILTYEAERDPLLGAYNKKVSEQLVEEHLQGGGSGTLWIIDIDNFKNINDNFGHLYGDRVLCDIYDELSQLFRDKDIIGRVGGDEFMVFMKDTIRESAVIAKAQQACYAIEKVYTKEGLADTGISASIGIAISPQHAKVFARLYEMADIALYATKGKGKNGFTIYSKEHANAKQTVDLSGR